MIYHYYDPWTGRVEIHRPTTTNLPVWTSTSGLRSIKQPQISVIKSDKFTTLVVRDNDDNIVVVVDLTAEEAANLVERLVNDNDS